LAFVIQIDICQQQQRRRSVNKDYLSQMTLNSRTSEMTQFTKIVSFTLCAIFSLQNQVAAG